MTVPDYYNCHCWFPFFNSPYCLLYISDNFSSENLEANQTKNSLVDFFLSSHRLSAGHSVENGRRNNYWLITFGRVEAVQEVEWTPFNVSLLCSHEKRFWKLYVIFRWFLSFSSGQSKAKVQWKSVYCNI